nr:response regulator [uncultured Bacillus sp.]
MINVLIVEDDPMVIEFNKRYLNQVEGFKLVAAVRSFEEAIEVLKNRKIQLILLDIYLPGLSGLELLAQMRKAGGEIDVIIVSAASDIQTIKKALQYGAVDYLIKPFEFERFRSALKDYKQRQSLINQKQELNQSELDLLIHTKEQRRVSSQLPKGLDKNTLKKIWAQIIEMKDQEFSTSELVRFVGISRVSMRKYLQFLHDIDALRMNIDYGSVGRPIYKYRHTADGNDRIDQYL